MEGKNFCESAKDAFYLIVRNPGSFATVHIFSNLYSIVGRFLIAIATTCCAYCYMINFAPDTPDIVPTCILIFFISLLIGLAFMSVMTQVSDAIILIFTMDGEISKVHHGR